MTTDRNLALPARQGLGMIARVLFASGTLAFLGLAR
jgi:hypothetical protein